jgi:hypothetical protein
MRTLLKLSLPLLLASRLLAEDVLTPPTTEPESFNWTAYVNEGLSVSDEMMRAEAGATALKKRIDEISATYVSLLKKRGDLEDVKLFEEMQAQWAKAVDAEVAFVGHGWTGGSGARAAYPRARMECYLRRVKELLVLKGRAVSLNE